MRSVNLQNRHSFSGNNAICSTIEIVYRILSSYSKWFFNSVSYIFESNTLLIRLRFRMVLSMFSLLIYYNKFNCSSAQLHNTHKNNGKSLKINPYYKHLKNYPIKFNSLTNFSAEISTRFSYSLIIKH